MGLFDGASSFFSILAGGEDLLAQDFPSDYQIQTSTLTLPQGGADAGSSKGKTEAPKDKPKTEAPKGDKGKGEKGKGEALTSARRKQLIERGASELLILLQREGRLVDFLEQDIDDYDDEDVGAAVREIHKGCRKVLREHFQVSPVLEGVEEDDDVTVPEGFDAAEIRLVGKVKGKPPFKGTLRHHGWKARKVSMPQVAPEVDANILAAAEVEL